MGYPCNLKNKLKTLGDKIMYKCTIWNLRMKHGRLALVVHTITLLTFPNMGKRFERYHKMFHYLYLFISFMEEMPYVWSSIFSPRF